LHLQSEILHCFLRIVRPPKTFLDSQAPPKKLSPPGAATRTSRRPACRRNETQKLRLLASSSQTAYKVQSRSPDRPANRNPPLRQPGCRPQTFARGRPYGFASRHCCRFAVSRM
jgi:hypothetical protein